MAEGTIKFYNAVKQFGFINGDDGKSYFFHASQIEKGVRLNDGDRVSFTIGQGDRGPRAEKVVKLVAGKAAEHKKAETHVKAVTLRGKSDEESEESPGEESEESKASPAGEDSDDSDEENEEDEEEF